MELVQPGADRRVVEGEALAAMRAAVLAPGNPSSLHSLGRTARRRLASGRAVVRRLAGARDDAEVLIAGSRAEANLLGLVGAARRALAPARVPRMLLARSLAELLRRNSALLDLPELAVEVVDAAQVASMSVTELSGVAVVGIVLEAREPTGHARAATLAARCAEAGARLHLDASDACSATRLTHSAWGEPSLVLSSPELGGPAGVAALVVPHGEVLEALWRGGPQQGGMRPGSEPVALWAGFEAAARAHLAARGPL